MKLTQSMYQLTFLIVLLSVFAGYNFMFADAPASPPVNNMPAPLTVGSVAQVKNGGLSLGTLYVIGNMQVAGVFALFNQSQAIQYCDKTGARCFTPGDYDCPAGFAINEIRADGTVDCIRIGSGTPPAPTYTYSWRTGSWRTTGYGSCVGSSRTVTRTRSVECVRNDGVTVADSFCPVPKPATTDSTRSFCSGGSDRDKRNDADGSYSG